MRRLPVSVVGGVGVVAGCAGMASMLPGAAAGALGAIGVGGSSALARTLSPVAQPLYIVSAVLVALGALACSRLVALLAISGSLLLYLSMFQLATSAASGGSMSTMTTTARSRSMLHAEQTTFYLGLALLLAGYALNAWHRYRRQCRPLLHLPQPMTARR
jgi:hypothetical protein